MVISELISAIKGQLLENAEFEAKEIVMYALGLSRNELILNPKREVTDSEKQMAAKAILSWETESMPEEVVPQKNLYTTSDKDEGDGLNALYQSMRQHIAYTKNNGNLYAISFEWPGEELVLHVPNPPGSSQVSLLGRKGLLPWTYKDGELTIDLSAIEYNQIPNHDAWTFKITEME